MNEFIMSDLTVKQYQEASGLSEMKEHNLRDAAIRKFVKAMVDYFRNTENSYRELGESAPFGSRERPHHAIVTHQDDMTKVDLP